MSAYPKKLIEVSIPLKEINEACAREKSIRHGHPSTLHLWWARRPLAAARSVLFCQLVDDPSGYVDELMADKARKQEAQQEMELELKMTPHLSPKLEDKLVEKERERLHNLVKELVIWENTTNEKVLNRARKEIQNSWARHLRRSGLPENTPMPPVLDPFAGGGAIPLEAQRLGMEAHASDLNPVAVLINKAMIEIPPKFAGMPPVNLDWQSKTKEQKAATTWSGAQGLAEDVRHYGQWMRAEAEKRIGHLYPPYTLTQELLDGRPDLVKAGYKAGDELTVIAWLWARTVPSPNPALQGKPVPLVSSYWLSKNAGKEVYIEPIVKSGDYHFEVRVGRPANPGIVEEGTKSGRGNFKCVISGVPIDVADIRKRGVEKQIGVTMTAIVCEGRRGRVYVPTNEEQAAIAQSAVPEWCPDQKLPEAALGFRIQNYGMAMWSDLFTRRQLATLAVFSNLVGEARERILADSSVVSHLSTDSKSLEDLGAGSQAYADAVAVYLAFVLSKMADLGNSLCRWEPLAQCPRNLFGKQTISMIWDYAEANPLSNSSGCWDVFVRGVLGGFEKISQTCSDSISGTVLQRNASVREITPGTIISTDPPYYDNIGYADLSDFFYVWLRRSLRETLPLSMRGILVPKEEELIASADRHGSKTKAEGFFLSGMTEVTRRWSESSSTHYPITIYYAFKQAEISSQGVSSTGWATFLDALMLAGLAVVGTWPARTENASRMRGQASNALASSIVLVCRQRPKTAKIITKREFIEALEAELPNALRELQHANLSPVDLPQSSIGPGMAIYSRYEKIIKGDGEQMTVTDALQLINHELSHLLDGQVSDMDASTRFACKWFEQHEFKSGLFGDAANIATAIDVPVDAVASSGILESGHGKVRILRPSELPATWNPEADSNRTIWEIVHHLIRLAEIGSDADCARVFAVLPYSEAAEARQLGYRLFTICDQNGWNQEAQAYNQLITNWQDYADLAATLPQADARPVQSDLSL